MKLGFGSTVLENCLLSGHMDGIGVYANNLWNEFESLGVNQKTVSFGSVKSNGKKVLGGVHHLPLAYNTQAGISLLTQTPFLGSSSLKNEIDIFFSPDHHIPKLKSIPVVATIMDTIPLVHPEFVSQGLRTLKNAAFKKTVHWADHIITISEYSKADIIKYFEIEEENISVVPLGVNDAFFERVSEREKQKVLEKYNLEPKFFIFVGTLQPRKNVLRLIDAFEQLPQDIQKSHPLVIIGKYGWGEEKLLHKLLNTNTTTSVRWLSSVTDNELYALLQSSIGMVYPSLYEGFGLPLLEGFASEIPVITSNTTSLPEVAEDAVLYIDPNSVQDISEKMRKLVEYDDLRLELVQKGKTRVQQFSWENSAQEHKRIFEKVLLS